MVSTIMSIAMDLYGVRRMRCLCFKTGMSLGRGKMSKMDTLIANEVTSAASATPIPAPTDRIAAARFVSGLFGISPHNHRTTLPGRPFSFPLRESVRFLSCRKYKNVNFFTRFLISVFRNDAVCSFAKSLIL